MDLKDLEVFCEVARRSGFAAASLEIGTTPAHISKRIAILESQLGVRLFHRTTRRVVITEDGERAYQWAQRILNDADAMSEAFSSAKKEPSGQLRIATSQRLGREHVAPILSLLGRRHPRLEVWLELLDRRVDLITENFDLDIRVGDPTQPHLIAQRMVESRRILCASPEYLAQRGHPRSVAELAEHECLLYRERDQPFGIWRLIGPKGIESVKVTSRFSSNHSDVVKGWSLDGKGICLLSVWDVAQPLLDGRAVRVLPSHHESADIWAMTSTRSAGSAKVRVCVEFLKEQLVSGPHALNTAAAG
ncbi:LysR substrate-binding domain-containing protein [Variovorax sp. JS1663]|uniref:LysR substrate-binding domain-containing protein n=1 Tax=Variovorax sp. JS1663 TaxID=1851577 RepID=UPI000B343C36|nr:LysR substrate-binding domain-containing protein [Variovorax sp. JS1663]OUM03671.1 LysR family transcriptional regulator [Variovorax sp. JS1663]